ncbi:ATPase [Aestuariibaculum sp. M13]|uniref:ATPase n=1 Tax=Aestuariibaculum sp. M13 TaxID=2967132 RepID=UPI002159D036|nr:ATPase [Aestuariibaculum sp. M13]MCR8666245.1 ATPase [Aestuariibaculum sp. M13]
MSSFCSNFNPKQPHIITEGAVSYELGELKGKVISYDFQKILIYLEAKGKLLFGRQFKIYEEDHEVLLKLVTYYIQDKSYCEHLGLDIEKGIMLSGPVGCGKTTLMKLLPCIAPYKKPYKIIPARNIVFGFNNLGHKIIEDYSDNQSYCFDDLGVEATGKHFGADCNVMGEILLSRYDINSISSFQNSYPHNVIPSAVEVRVTRNKTHATTNLNAQELEEKYGERVRSRMRSMFNLIAFKRESLDKRK